jgi:hypothetical protein
MRQMMGDHGGLHRIRLEGSLDEQARLLVHLTDCDHSERWPGNIYTSGNLGDAQSSEQVPGETTQNAVNDR